MSLTAIRAGSWVGAIAAALLLAGAATGAPARREVRIDVLLSHDAPPYHEALAGFRRTLQHVLEAEVRIHNLQGDLQAASAAVAQARQGGASLLLTLGSVATRAAVREARDVPIVAGMILNAEDLGGVPNATGVVLEFPVETELRWLQRVLPRQRRVSVLYHSAENRARVEAAQRVARGLGLVLVARLVESARDLPDALESLARDTDVLWGLADQVVLTPQTAKPILLFSLRHRIPFVGLSLTWVKAGALGALDRDYGDIGAQCGELATRILQGAPPASLAPVAPRRAVYSVNLKTAHHMKVDLAADLVKGAQTVVE